MSTLPINAAAANPSANPAAASAASTKPAAAGGLADENTFLKLLVAQLKNQDPQNPADGTQFVTQLAQFSGLEQQLGMKADLDQILAQLQNSGTPAAASASAAPA